MSIRQVLMERDGMSEEEAEALIEEARNDLLERLNAGDPYMDAEDICEEYFGLEPDYLLELI